VLEPEPVGGDGADEASKGDWAIRGDDMGLRIGDPDPRDREPVESLRNGVNTEGMPFARSLLADCD
jgi:hypothetical protein